MSFFRRHATSTSPRPPTVSPVRTRHRSTSFIGILARLFCLLLFTQVLTNLPPVVDHAFAAPPPAPAPATRHVQQFLTQGQPENIYHGPFRRPAQDAVTTALGKAVTSSQTSTPRLPSAEPATMKALDYTLDSSFVLNRPAEPTTPGTPTAQATFKAQPASIPAGSTSLQVMGSDGRLEVALPRTAVDLAKAALTNGSAPSGQLTLHIYQRHGHYSGQESMLGSYRIEVLDGTRQVVHHIHLRQPLTIRYHYQPWEMSDLNLDPDTLLLSWRDPLATAQAATGAPAQTAKGGLLQRPPRTWSCL